MPTKDGNAVVCLFSHTGEPPAIASSLTTFRRLHVRTHHLPHHLPCHARHGTSHACLPPTPTLFLTLGHFARRQNSPTSRLPTCRAPYPRAASCLRAPFLYLPREHRLYLNTVRAPSRTRRVPAAMPLPRHWRGTATALPTPEGGALKRHAPRRAPPATRLG